MSFKYYLGVACTYKHHHTDTIFLYTIFVPMSRPRFMSYLCDLLFIFNFICIMINRINTDTLVLSLNFQNMFYYFYVITWMKNVNKFPNSKSSPSGCCLAFAWFYANFSLEWLIKVLLKKSVYLKNLPGSIRFSDVFRVYRKATLGCNGLMAKSR